VGSHKLKPEALHAFFPLGLRPKSKATRYAGGGLLIGTWQSFQAFELTSMRLNVIFTLIQIGYK
jgi:hypothetical protein